MKRGIVVLAAAVLCASISVARAQDDGGLSLMATAVMMYNETSASCYYEPVVGQTIRDLDDAYSRSSAFQWRALKEALSDGRSHQTLEAMIAGGCGI